MSLKNRIFGFKTKNLYIGELRHGISYENNGHTWYGIRSYQPKKYVLVRTTRYKLYTDVFTGSVYDQYDGDKYTIVNKNVVDKLNPIVSNKKRIKFKDAEEILKTKNTVFIKK